MAIITKAPRGTQDVLPEQSGKWQYIEKTALETASLYGFKEIRFPTFEHTELFARGVGDGTDVVQKEMYTFQDKGERSITLRPEGTAGAMRTLIEHGVLAAISQADSTTKSPRRGAFANSTSSARSCSARLLPRRTPK